MLVAYCLDLGSTVCCEVEGLMFEFEPAGSFSHLSSSLSSSADLHCCSQHRATQQVAASPGSGCALLR
jgi:hypothetical protein